MKKLLKITAVFLLSSILFLVSCSKASLDNNSTDAATDSVTTNLISGKWLVSSFIEKTEDKTSKFAGTLFTFKANGTVSATDKNGNISDGSWKFTPAITYYGSTSTAAIALNMGISKPLDLLTKTWNFIVSSSTLLKIDSPELLEDKHVQFSKQ
ncbi:MAG: hypothetical protein ACKVOW_17010 [Chitinophagaceae bacterium]